MTPAEFQRIAEKTRLSENSISIARHVLVNGEGYAEAGKKYGIDRRLAYQSVRQLLAARSKDEEASGYGQRTYCGPPDLLEKLDRVADSYEKARKSAKNQRTGAE